MLDYTPFSQGRLEKDPDANGLRPFQRCSLSLMDTIADPGIRFDENGVSNYYHEYKQAEQNHTLTGEPAKKKVRELLKQIKAKGRFKKYDCVIGISGGVDSTYLAYLAAEYGLRALCVHFDNGWNSELANENIRNIISKCNFDLKTYVVHWPEFRDIQRAYFKAGVIDIEAITDLAIADALSVITREFGIPFVLSGTNVWTEQVLPKAWINKNRQNLYNIHQQFGELPLNNFPTKFKNGKYLPTKGNYTSVSLLNYELYDKKKAKETIIKHLNWRDYGGKHYESVFTRFYQGFILPQKFNVDKRKAHLSNLIFAGQMTLEQAIQEIDQPMYSQEQLRVDMPFALKKLGFSETWFEEYIALPAVPHAHYGDESVVVKKSVIGKLRFAAGKYRRKIIGR